MTQIENKIKSEVIKAVKQAFDYDISDADFVIELPKDKNHGDYATNVALQLTKQLQNNPRAIAQRIIDNLDREEADIADCVIAGPGFINFTMQSEALTALIAKVLKEGDDYGRGNYSGKERYNLEYVSANPTGDLHPGHARGAAMGDSIARIMKFAGYDVTREYYVNDAGNQMNLMAKSLQARYFQGLNQKMEVPSDGYHGKDIIEAAEKLIAEVGDRYLNVDPEESLAKFREYGLIALLANIKETMKKFRVEFDVWTSEQSLYERNMIEEALNKLNILGMTYQKDGALWLKTTEFADDKDRVIIKSDGSYTYLTPDIAYHLNKFNRGYDKLIDFLGADHHGYISRLKAAIGALGHNENDLDVIIIQMARMIKDGEEYRMSKRTGKAIALSDLIEEAGVDAIRYLFVSKAADTHMDLDLDLATRQTNENPVYYVQYAHARLCSILKNVGDYSVSLDHGLLTHTKEMALLKQINEFGKVVIDAAETKQPHKLCNYTHKLATLVHSYYNECKIIGEDKELQNQRLALVEATKITLKNALNLIGVEAVERM